MTALLIIVRKIVMTMPHRDKRIKVIHKLNGGLSDARNAGLRIDNGDVDVLNLRLENYC